MHQDVIDKSIRTGESEDLSKFIEEVGDFQVCAGQRQHHQTVEQGVHNVNEQGAKNHQTTETGVHDDCLIQRVADGHVTVISHDGQEQIVHTYENHEKIHLNEAACIGDDFVPCLDVHQHLGGYSGGETDVNKGQVGEEEVHGGVEVGV